MSNRLLEKITWYIFNLYFGTIVEMIIFNTKYNSPCYLGSTHFNESLIGNLELNIH